MKSIYRIYPDEDRFTALKKGVVSGSCYSHSFAAYFQMNSAPDFQDALLRLTAPSRLSSALSEQNGWLEIEYLDRYQHWIHIEWTLLDDASILMTFRDISDARDSELAAEAALQSAMLETQAALARASQYRKALLSGAMLAYRFNVSADHILEILQDPGIRLPETGSYDTWLHQFAEGLPISLRESYWTRFCTKHLLECYDRGQYEVTMEYPLPNGKNTSLQVRQSVLLTLDWQSENILAFCTVKNITLEKRGNVQFQEGLKDVYDMFSLLSHHTSDISILIDAGTHRVEYVSPNIQRLLGTAHPRIRYDDQHQIYFEEYECDPQLLKLIHEEWDHTGDIKSDFIPVVNPVTHEKFWICCHLYHIQEADFDKYVVILNDMTREREQQEDLRLALRDAAHANAAKSDFLSRMSHDIRTPLNAIMGLNTIALAHPEDTARIQDCLHKMAASSKHLLALINDVLDMSRIETGRLELAREPFQLSCILESLKPLIQPQTSAKKQTLTISSRLQHDHVIGDSTHLMQILTNILSNAVKYTPDGGCIDFTLKEKAPSRDGNMGYYEFLCRDTGIGMEPEFLQQIFEPFTRAEDSRTSKIQGTGLGMAIARSIARLMGGDIRVESQVGQGSLFTLRVALELDAEPAATEPPASEPVDFSGYQALLVEDNELNLEIAVEMLEMLGLTIDTAVNGSVAVDKVRSHTYDLIFMDVQMPVMNGYEATEKIRQLGYDVPIIAMTANAFTEDVQQALAAGMNAHIAKPLDLEQITNTLRDLL